MPVSHSRLGSCVRRGDNARPVAMKVQVLCLLSFISLVCSPLVGQTFTVVHAFTDGIDGMLPYAGVTSDGHGHLYGTTSAGGSHAGDCGSLGCGIAYRLQQAGSGWVFTPLYRFAGGSDGSGPVAGLTIGPNGALY